MGGPLVVVGLDGATLDLVEPWAAAGHLPVLARLLERGAHGRLRSTIPAATFPAWTSLVTGVNPGRHGVLDFTERVPGTYRVRFVNGSHRRTPALWTRLGASGWRVAVVTVPATYPPEPVPGVMVSGWDTPLTTAVNGSFVFPRQRWPELQTVAGRLPFADFQEVRPGHGWHARALESLLDGIRRRTALVRHLLERDQPDFLMVVYGESDTVAHHFWRFHDPASPRFEEAPFGEAVVRVYRALDAALGKLLALVPPTATVAVVSDHGSGGASDLAVYVNRRLAEGGYLRFRARGGPGARLLRSTALRAVPPRLQGPLLRRLPAAAGRVEAAVRFGAIDWSGTDAYSEELDYHPSVWINLAGREPAGRVSPSRRHEVREAVAAHLTAWRHADGRAVLERVWRREEVCWGPAEENAPDLLLEIAEVDGYRPSCVRSGDPGPTVEPLPRERWGGGKGSGMSGSHRRDGLFVLAGPAVRRGGRLPAAAITDVLPTVLALVGEPIPLGLDGAPIAGALACEVVFAPDPLGERFAHPAETCEAADDELTRRLAALGYLEPGR